MTVKCNIRVTEIVNPLRCSFQNYTKLSVVSWYYYIAGGNI